MYTVPDGRKREGQFIRITIQVSDIFLILPFGQGHATESSHIGFCGIRIILLRIHGPCPGHTEGKAYAGAASGKPDEIYRGRTGYIIYRGRTPSSEGIQPSPETERQGLEEILQVGIQLQQGLSVRQGGKTSRGRG